MTARKPTPIKVLHGTARPDRTNPNEPHYSSPTSLEPPAWLDAEASGHWRLLAGKLAEAGVLTEVDAPLLAAACERWSVYTRAAARLRRNLTVRSRANGAVSRPELAIARGALADYLGLMREFGVGPASRGKVT